MTVLLGQQTRSSNRQIVTDGSRLRTLLLYLVLLSLIPVILISFRHFVQRLSYLFDI